MPSVTLLEAALADLPAKLRVHELAKRAGVSSKEAIAALAAQGVSVGSASSTVDRDIAIAVITATIGGSASADASSSAPLALPGAGVSPLFLPPDSASATRRGSKAASAAQAGRGDAVPAPEPVADDRAEATGAAATSRRRGRSGRDGQSPDQDQAAEASAPLAQRDQDETPAADDDGRPKTGRRSRSRAPEDRARSDASEAVAALGAAAGGRRGKATGAAAAVASEEAQSGHAGMDVHPVDGGEESEESDGHRRRRRRGRRGRGRAGDDVESSTDADSGTDAAATSTDGSPALGSGGSDTDVESGTDTADADAPGDAESSGDEEPEGTGSRRRRRRRRRSGSGGSDGSHEDDPDDTVVHLRESRSSESRSSESRSSESRSSESRSSESKSSEVQGVRGSTRLEAKRQRRRETQGSRVRPQILSEAEFLARRESVERVMAVRQRGDLAQVALLEDGVLVEHFVSRAGSESMIGNVYLGRVQNVLPSMEAAFVDIGRGRNAVLYAGEVNWDMAGLVGKARRIETAMNSGDTLLVQVSKDPIGHKGSRLTTQISLPGRFLVYVPGGGATGISRKLADTERKRLKAILDRIVPDDAGVIIRTAAEGIGEEELANDVERLKAQWEEITKAAEKQKSKAPVQLSAEPDTLIKVIRDLFNSDITSLVIDGDDAFTSVSDYVSGVAPELAGRVKRFDGSGDVFSAYRVSEQIAKALERKVHLPSGGSLVIDRTEAMTVIDVNTGKYTGSGGNLEETVTRNNLEAAEEIVRQLRLRDIGGIIVVDFIDMVLVSNRDLVIRRLTECLGRDRTRHQVAEVTSLGLVQMTRKRMGLGLVEAFSESCSHCGGRGIVLHDVPVDSAAGASGAADDGGHSDKRSVRSRKGRGGAAATGTSANSGISANTVAIERVATDAKPDPRGPKPPGTYRHSDQSDSSVELADSAEAVPVKDDPAGAAMPAESAVAEAVVRAEPTAGTGDDAAEGAIAPAEPTGSSRGRRGRRAAGRPAGAPSTAGAAVDIVIPATAPPNGPDAPAAAEVAASDGGSSAGDDGSTKPAEADQAPEADKLAKAAKAAKTGKTAGSKTAGSKTAGSKTAGRRSVAKPAADDGADGAPSPAEAGPAVTGSAESTPATATLATVGTADSSRPPRRRAASRPAGPAGPVG